MNWYWHALATPLRVHNGAIPTSWGTINTGIGREALVYLKLTVGASAASKRIGFRRKGDTNYPGPNTSPYSDSTRHMHSLDLSDNEATGVVCTTDEDGLIEWQCPQGGVTATLDTLGALDFTLLEVPLPVESTQNAWHTVDVSDLVGSRRVLLMLRAKGEPGGSDIYRISFKPGDLTYGQQGSFFDVNTSESCEFRWTNANPSYACGMVMPLTSKSGTFQYYYNPVSGGDINFEVVGFAPIDGDEVLIHDGSIATGWQTKDLNPYIQRPGPALAIVQFAAMNTTRQFAVRPNGDGTEYTNGGVGTYRAGLITGPVGWAGTTLGCYGIVPTDLNRVIQYDKGTTLLTNGKILLLGFGAPLPDVTIYGTEGDSPEWSAPGEAGSLLRSSILETYNPWPIPGSEQATYLNKCVDGVTGQWVLWHTFFQDRQGSYYPGQSFDPGTYKVETIVHE